MYDAHVIAWRVTGISALLRMFLENAEPGTPKVFETENDVIRYCVDTARARGWFSDEPIRDVALRGEDEGWGRVSRIFYVDESGVATETIVYERVDKALENKFVF